MINDMLLLQNVTLMFELRVRAEAVGFTGIFSKKKKGTHV